MRNFIRKAAMLLVCLTTAGICWAQNGDPWQVGDVAVCSGGGKCAVLRIVNGTPTLLDSLNDGVGGNTYGTAINNTLHLLTTDDAGGGASDVVLWSIASVNPLSGLPVSHTVLNTFTPSGANIRAVVLNSAGHMFIGNSGSGLSPTPSIVELTATGALASPSALPTNPFTLPAGCTDIKGGLLSMDLSAEGSALYLTSGGPTIQKLALASGTCTPFANFGSNVTLYGIKDIPPNALVGQNCGGVACPPDELLLVVATGFTDPDQTSTVNDSDPINICTNSTDNSQYPCALLLDVNPAPGSQVGSLWQANTAYSLNALALDPSLRQQYAYTAGKSGADEPPFNTATNASPVIDNAVIWTNQGQPPWAADHLYSVVAPPLPTTGTYIVDSNFNLETVTQVGISGHGPNHPTWVAETVDGLQWNDLGVLMRVPSSPSPYTVGNLVSDPLTHAQKVIQAGETGSGALPAGGWHEDGLTNTVEGVTWTESNPTWMKNTPFGVGTLIIDNFFHVQQVQQAGTSVNNDTQPAFSGTTNDNTVTWVDLGQAVWRPSFGYGLNAIIEDGNGHVQQVTTVGTSGPGPAPSFSPSLTTDGLQWSDDGLDAWACGTPYPLNAAIVDGAGHVQQVVAAGTSTMCPSPAPSFNDAGSTTPDNTVTWQDRGPGGSWAAQMAFSLNAFIVDTNNHVQQAVSAGTSGSVAPAFSTSGGTVGDNAVVWTDRGTLNGSNFAWKASTGYVVNAEIIDNNQHVELATVVGTSGFGIAAPKFVDGSTTPDGTETWTDLGLAVWRANFSYGLNAIIVDAANHVQQVTTAGTSGAGPNPPSFLDDGSSSTPDGSVTWTDRGQLTAASAFTWQINTTYSLNRMIVDSNNHVELATTSPQGQSGGGNAPVFQDGGSVTDGLIWADQGAPHWIPNHPYLMAGNIPVPLPGSYIIDDNNHLEMVTIPGISGPAAPAWPQSGQTIDGLIWADQGAWLAGHQYFTWGQPVGDSNGHVHTVAATGTSGSGAQPAGGWNDGNGTNGGLTAAGTTIDNAVIWTESHPNWQGNHSYMVGNTDTLILDGNNNVELVTNDNVNSVGTTAVSGPSQPSLPHNPWNQTTGGKTIDGLQWQLQAAPNTSVLARYYIGSTTFNIQSLALAPLIADCTGSKCSGSAQPPTTTQFWLADSTSSNFFAVPFNSAQPVTQITSQPYDANTACTGGCGISKIQSIGIYGGEGSNQPDLTKIFTGPVSSASNTGIGKFPPPINPVTNSANLNTFTVSAYGLTSSYGMNLYGSLVALPSCFSDPTPGNPSLPCQPTTADPNSAIVWKVDVPTPGAPTPNGVLALPSGTYVSEKAKSPASLATLNPPLGIDFNTDGFIDAFYDATVASGNIDPIVGGKSSQLLLVERAGNNLQFPGAACVYTSPVQGACYKTNRTTLNFTFQCPGLTSSQFIGLQNTPNPPGPPVASLLQTITGASGKIISLNGPLGGTNGKAPYRYSSSINSYTFQWNLANAVKNGQVSATGTTNLYLTTYQQGILPPFSISFKTDPTCK